MKPHELGQIAYDNGQSLLANPFNWDELGSEHRHTLWNDGWIAASNADTPAGRLYKMLASTGISMATCLAAQERLEG